LLSKFVSIPKPNFSNYPSLKNNLCVDKGPNDTEVNECNILDTAFSVKWSGSVNAALALSPTSPYIRFGAGAIGDGTGAALHCISRSTKTLYCGSLRLWFEQLFREYKNYLEYIKPFASLGSGSGLEPLRITIAHHNALL
jgi:hypothetical protein